MKKTMVWLVLFTGLFGTGYAQTTTAAQRFQLYSWDNDQATTSYIRSTSGTSGPWGLTFWTNGQERMGISSNGAIGIGLGSTPILAGSKLDVNGLINSRGIAFSSSLGGGDKEYIRNTHQTGPDPYGISMFVNDTARMTILGNGNVGIGTKNPTSPLSLGTVGKDRLIGLWDAPTDWYGMGIGLYQYRFNIGNHSARFSFLAGTTSTTELMTIQGNGNVGIGTTTPNKGKLHIKGSFHVENDSAQVFHVSAGKQLVFVGTTAYEKYQAVQGDTSSPINKGQYALWVSQGIVSEDYVITDVDNWDDYVFADHYQLPSLAQTAAFIKKNKHLPNFPSEAAIKKNGYNLHQMNRNFLRTIEEMTLHAISQENKIIELEAKLEQVSQLAAELEALKTVIRELKNHPTK